LGEMWPTKCSYSGELKVVLTTVPTASKLLIKFSINVLTLFLLHQSYTQQRCACKGRLALFVALVL
jgi:hypothetical protein